MPRIAHLNRTLKQVFEQDAVELARQAGMRQRTISFSHLAIVLVMGWWSQPGSGPSALARFAGSVDETLSKQAVDCHFTERTATWLLALLHCVVNQVIACSSQQDVQSWMHPFAGVFVEDGSPISLPTLGLAWLWRNQARSE